MRDRQQEQTAESETPRPPTSQREGRARGGTGQNGARRGSGGPRAESGCGGTLRAAVHPRHSPDRTNVSVSPDARAATTGRGSQRRVRRPGPGRRAAACPHPTSRGGAHSPLVATLSQLHGRIFLLTGTDLVSSETRNITFAPLPASSSTRASHQQSSAEISTISPGTGAHPLSQSSGERRRRALSTFSLSFLPLLSTKAVYSTSKSFLPAFLTTVAPDHEFWKPSSSFLTSTESPALIFCLE
mmetsp:Transcript_1412/g.4362  ORF Transcript_1412/g.4362 Transcript_1412/m.4362 type:complete len:243 (-) Transcript_1412:677-1405(-)